MNPTQRIFHSLVDATAFITNPAYQLNVESFRDFGKIRKLGKSLFFCHSNLIMIRWANLVDPPLVILLPVAAVPCNWNTNRLWCISGFLPYEFCEIRRSRSWGSWCSLRVIIAFFVRSIARFWGKLFEVVIGIWIIWWISLLLLGIISGIVWQKFFVKFQRVAQSVVTQFLMKLGKPFPLLIGLSSLFSKRSPYVLEAD